MTYPILQTERLILRAPVLADFEHPAAFYASGRSVTEGGPLFRVAAFALEAAQAARTWALDTRRVAPLVSCIARESARSRALAARLGAWPGGEGDGCTIWRHAPLSERPA